MPTLADYPELVAQLDAKKNGPLAPESIGPASRRKLWWRCPAGPDHLWETTVLQRARAGRGCPYCAGQRVSVTNALSKVAPAIAREWHPTKNGALRPRDVVAGSNRAVWWKCRKGPEHEWRTTIQARARRGAGCPFCVGRRATAANNLAVAYPETAREWHPTRNGTLRAEDVTPRSSRNVWWMCARGHAWSAPPKTRTKGHGCPYCTGVRAAPETSLAALDPALAKQWHRTRNGALTPHDVTLGSGRPVWWKCRKGPDHEWRAGVAHRREGTGCPFCAGRRVSVTRSFASAHPELVSEWHPTKNGGLTPHDVTPASNRHVVWKCPKGRDHEWRTTVGSRHGGTGCPFCANVRVSVTNSLAARFPKLAREWHPTKNGNLRPGDVTAGTPRRVWWRCALGHEWQATVGGRTGKGAGCPYCSNARVSATNSLAARYPKLAREWHPTKNGALGPGDVTAGTRRRAWWRCTFGHAWQAVVSSRSRNGCGCPECWRLRRRQPVATTGRRRTPVRFAAYEGARHGPVRRVR